MLVRLGEFFRKNHCQIVKYDLMTNVIGITIYVIISVAFNQPNPSTAVMATENEIEDDGNATLLKYYI